MVGKNLRAEARGLVFALNERDDRRITSIPISVVSDNIGEMHHYVMRAHFKSVSDTSRRLLEVVARRNSADSEVTLIMDKLVDNDAAEKPRVQTAARTIKVLTEVALAGPNGISAKAISVNLDLPRQVVYHLLHTLVSVGVLRRANGSTYVLGLAVAPIAEGFRLQLGAGDMLARYATMAANATGETAYVVGWVGNEIVVLASARGRSAIAATEIPQGTTGDAHARASGKLLLSHIASEVLDDYIARHPLVARTPNTITTRKEFVSALDRIREESVSYDREEYSSGLACMAVPLGSRRMVRLVLGISAPAERFYANLENYRDMLVNIASIQDVDGS